MPNQEAPRQSSHCSTDPWGWQHPPGAFTPEDPALTMLPRAVGMMCMCGDAVKTGNACERMKQTAPPIASAAHKGQEMAVCSSEFKEGSQAHHCTPQLLWLEHPWSSGKPLRVAAYTPGQTSSTTAMRTFTQPDHFLHRPHVYTASKRQHKHHTCSHL